MADYLIKDTTLTNIADAIRAKKSSTDTYTPAEMAIAISSIETGGEELTEEDLTFTGDLSYFNYYGRMSKIIKKCGSKMRFNGITNLFKSFIGNDPLNSDFSNWTINLSKCSLYDTFRANDSIKKYPKFSGTISSLQTVFNDSSKTLLPDDVFSNTTFLLESTSNNYNGIFSDCPNLKKTPLWFENMTFTTKDFTFSYAYSTLYNSTFNGDKNLKEMVLPIIPAPIKLKANCFSNTFKYVSKARKIIFAPPPAGNEAVLWTKQTINLADTNFGYSNSAIQMTGNVISDDETYNLYKNDPDAWAYKLEYSFYNHDSALETIKSLPYAQMVDIPQSQLQNVIKFYGKSGEKTDGGAINTLTAEEIAIATNKGWTVSFV